MDNKKPFSLFLLFIFLLGLFALTGSKIHFEKMYDPRPRVLSMFTQTPEGFYKVIDNADGDTLHILIDGKEETVRLLGVDTPETKDPRKPVQCFGHQASDFTKQLVTGKAVHLIPDPSQTDRDTFGRLLRYVYFEDGTTLNERLVYEGYAFAYEKYPTMRLEKMKELEHDAQVHKRGLWGSCEVTITGKIKKTQDMKE
jgi:micrococcal nuclease